MKKYNLIFLCMFLPCILYAETTSDIINDVKIIMDNGIWVPKYSLDVLESKNRDYMSNFVKNVESFNLDITEIDRLDGLIPFDSDEPPNIIFWYERELSLEPIEIGQNWADKDVFHVGSSYQNYIIILDAIYVRDMIRFTGKLSDGLVTTMLDWSKLTENEKTFDMFFIFDGDYLHIYIDEVLPENLFYTFASIDDATVNEFKTLMASNTCDLSKVTWPRYADGTSDYDDRIILKDTVANHEVGKTYLTTDNLRFREKEGVAGNPLFTLPKDAPVTVLRLGTTEIIDSITADWLQIEVAEDTIDTAGNEVKKGAVGWCFGGYVTTSPEIVVEEEVPELVAEVTDPVPEIVTEITEPVPEIIAEVAPEKVDEVLPELESTEQANPITVWVLLGGGVLLVGAVVVVVIVMRKKKK